MVSLIAEEANEIVTLMTHLNGLKHIEADGFDVYDSNGDRIGRLENNGTSGWSFDYDGETE